MKTKLYIILAFVGLLYGCSESTIGEEVRGSLTGTVIAAETDEPLENVKISTNPSSSTVFTDENGVFNIENILTDDYSVQAEAEGFTTAFEAVTIISNETSNVAFELSISSTTNLGPSVPELLTPDDGATGIDIQTTLVWSSSETDSDEITYTVDLRNGTTNEVETFEVVQDTMITVSDLRLSTNYFWQVKASDDTNDPVSSSISSFTTLDSPANPILFVRKIAGKNIIYSGGFTDDGMATDVNVIRLTSENENSFRPRKNNTVNRIAFLRTVGGDTHLFTMSLGGEDIRQVTTDVPVAGFKQEEINFTWANDGAKLYYPNFNTLYSINPDGSGREVIYEAPVNTFISEVDLPEITSNIAAIKTNNAQGYNVNIFTIDLNTGIEQTLIFSGMEGAVSGLDISANADSIIYTYDISAEENAQYRRFSSRIFRYDFAANSSTNISSGIAVGENDLDARYSPTEGRVIYTRVDNDLSGVPVIGSFEFSGGEDETIVFTNGAKMVDWK